MKYINLSKNYTSASLLAIFFYADHKSDGVFVFFVGFSSPLYILKLLSLIVLNIYFCFFFVFEQNNVVAPTTLTTSRVGSRWQIFGRRSPVLHWHNFLDA